MLSERERGGVLSSSGSCGKGAPHMDPRLRDCRGQRWRGNLYPATALAASLGLLLSACGAPGHFLLSVLILLGAVAWLMVTGAL